MTAVTSDPEALSEMIGLVYDSALAELQWQDLTDRLHAMFPQACFTMTGQPDPNKTDCHVTSEDKTTGTFELVDESNALIKRCGV